MHNNTLSPQLSVYLDLCRFFAAVIVVLAHLTHFGVATGDWVKWLPESGRDAVILFFLLSGYVICYTCHKKNDTLDTYTIARATRIYSVALPVLLITVLVDLIGLQFNPDNYAGLYQYEKLYIYIPLHLGFLGEIWTLSEQPFTLTPYWSLGYEVWYYVLFAALYFYTGTKRFLIFLVLFLFVGYKLWLLFPLWLAGVLLYHYHNRWQLSTLTANLLFYGSLVLYIIYKYFQLDVYLIQFGVELWPFISLALGSAHKYLSDYVVCLLVICHLYAARHVDLTWVMKYQKVIVLLASYTFTLYLVHAPVMLTISYNTDINTDSVIPTLVVLVLVAFITWGVGLVTEKRKHRFKPPILWVSNLVVSLVNKLPWLKGILTPNKDIHKVKVRE